MVVALVDKLPDDAQAQLLAHVSGKTAYLLVEQALAPTPSARLCRKYVRVPAAKVFEGRYAGEGVLDASPLLFKIPDAQADRDDFLHRWLRVSSGLPMLSIIIADRELPDVTRHLQGQLEAAGPDGVQYVFRWADTRSLALLREILSDTQRARLMWALQSWGWFDRDGVWTEMEHAAALVTVESDTFAPYRLNEDQMRAIHDVSVADTLLRYFCSKGRGFVVHGKPSQVYACIHQSLAQLRAGVNGVSSTGEQSRCALQALLSEQLATVEQEA